MSFTFLVVLRHGRMPDFQSNDRVNGGFGEILYYYFL